jgi:hypothetical protein
MSRKRELHSHEEDPSRKKHKNNEFSKKLKEFLELDPNTMIEFDGQVVDIDRDLNTYPFVHADGITPRKIIQYLYDHKSAISDGIPQLSMLPQPRDVGDAEHLKLYVSDMQRLAKLPIELLFGKELRKPPTDGESGTRMYKQFWNKSNPYERYIMMKNYGQLPGSVFNFGGKTKRTRSNKRMRKNKRKTARR